MDAITGTAAVVKASDCTLRGTAYGHWHASASLWEFYLADKKKDSYGMSATIYQRRCIPEGNDVYITGVGTSSLAFYSTTHCFTWGASDRLQL